jgi:spermidine/putrescine-binding protein
MAHSRLTRRSFLGLAAGLGLAGCGPAEKASRERQSSEHAGQTLRMFVYAGGHEKTVREVFVPVFEAQTGATVVLDPGWWDGIPRLKASPKDKPAFDLMVTDATQGFPAAREGLFQQLDLDHLPNRKDLVPSVLDHWIYRDRYGVPLPSSAMTLAYHKELVPDAPTGWGDLMRDGLRGKLALYNSFYMSLYTFACMKVASEGKAGTAAQFLEKDLDEVLRFAREQRDRVRFWWPTSTDMVLALDRKDCAAGNMHSPEMLQALRQRPSLGAIVPEADRAFVLGFWAIPAGTARRELALLALDTLLSEEVQLGFARDGSATGVPAVARTLAEEDPYWKQIYPHTEEQLHALRYYPYDVYFRHWDDLAAAWDRTVLRKG